MTVSCILYPIPHSCNAEAHRYPDIILSLVRTTRPGYLRDVRRLTVALSRARLGLYILGRRSVFEQCPELKPAFEILFQRPDKLQLATGEMFPTQRGINDKAESSEMDSVEHLGQYVYEMTQAKVKALREEGRQLAQLEEENPVRVGSDEEDDEDDGGVAVKDEDDDEDGYIPLDGGDEQAEPEAA